MAGIDSGGKDKFSINLYPMLDIFSILICFLLMNFSTEGQSVDSKANLELPTSLVRLSLDESATVSITRSEIVIQGGAVSIPIVAGDVPEDVRTQGAIKPAYEEFKKLRANLETLKNRDQSLSLVESQLNTLSMEADKGTEFKLIKRVMLSAQQAEFVGWKLAAMKAAIE